MSHIILTSNLPPETLREQSEAEGMTLAEFDRTRQQLEAMFWEGSFSELLKGNATFTARGVIDQYGDTYDEITIRVDGRFKRNGDIWLTGGGFAINMSGTLREIRESLV